MFIDEAIVSELNNLHTQIRPNLIRYNNIVADLNDRNITDFEENYSWFSELKENRKSDDAFHYMLTDYKYKNKVTRGQKAEDKFATIAKSKNFSLTKSTLQQDKTEHWDWEICKAQVNGFYKRKIDVKALKQIKPRGPAANSDHYYSCKNEQFAIQSKSLLFLVIRYQFRDKTLKKVLDQ